MIETTRANTFSRANFVSIVPKTSPAWERAGRIRKRVGAATAPSAIPPPIQMARPRLYNRLIRRYDQLGTEVSIADGGEKTGNRKRGRGRELSVVFNCG